MSSLKLRIVCVVALLGCGPVAPDPDAGGGTDGTGDDGGDDSNDDGGDSSSSGGGSSGGGSSSSSGGSSSSSGGSSSGGDGDDPSESLVEACERICRKLIECFPDQPDMDVCMDMCFESSGGGPECEKPMIEYYDCWAALPCSAFEDGEEHCVEEEAAIPPECYGEEECAFGGGGNEDGTECEVGEYCPDYTHEMVCDTELCECLVDGQVIARCPANGICTADGDALFDYFYECCNFP